MNAGNIAKTEPKKREKSASTRFSSAFIVDYVMRWMRARERERARARESLCPHFWMLRCSTFVLHKGKPLLDYYLYFSTFHLLNKSVERRLCKAFPFSYIGFGLPTSLRCPFNSCVMLFMATYKMLPPSRHVIFLIIFWYDILPLNFFSF